MSGAPIMSGTNQFPKPPISAGMTTKKIMIRPCAVMVHVIEVLGGVDRRLRRGAIDDLSEMVEDLDAGLLQLHPHQNRQAAADKPGTIAKRI